MTYAASENDFAFTKTALILRILTKAFRCFSVLALAIGVASVGMAQEPPAPTLQSEAPALSAPLPDSRSSLPFGPFVPDTATPRVAPDTPPAAAPSPADGVLPQDLSPLGMFRAAHWVVQGVMILLGAASLATWTVLLFKLIEMLAVNRRLSRSAATIRDAKNLPEVAAALHTRRDPAAFMAQAALEEMRRSDPVLALAGPGGVKERVRSMLERVEVQAAKRLRRGTGVLATIGSTAPFVGLFGTVWGIMNAFIRISETKSTNLAVVAPGIAEALLATAIGLVAAIPAVVIYNHFARSIANYRVMLGDAGAGIERLVSRDLDFRGANLPGSQRPPVVQTARMLARG